jgi:hypothetical protein
LAEPLGGRPAGGNWPRGRGGGFQKLVSTGGARASLEASLTMVNPANTFDYTPALIQFVLSNRLVDVALVGMRIIREVESCVGIWKDESGRIDIDALWRRFISDQKINA